MLTDLATVKTHLGITGTTEDAIITALLPLADSFIAEYIEAPVADTVFTKVFDGEGSECLSLPHNPVRFSTYGTASHVKIDGVLIEETLIKFDLELGFLHYDYFPEGKVNVEVKYNTGFTSSPADLSMVATKIVAKMYKGEKVAQAGDEQGQRTKTEKVGDTAVTYEYEKGADLGLSKLDITILDSYKNGRLHVI